jgi:hypothetical protein
LEIDDMKFDADAVKIALTVFALLISLVSLWLSMRTAARSQRREFETRRGLLAVQITQNNATVESMNLRAILLLEDLNELNKRVPPDKVKHIGYHIADLEKLSAGLTEMRTARAVTPEGVSQIKYKPANMEAISSALDTECRIAADLKQEAWETIFKRVEGFVKTEARTAVA